MFSVADAIVVRTLVLLHGRVTPCIVFLVGMFPGIPTAPLARTIRSKPTQLYVNFNAPRSNGAEIFEYDVWRRRIRGDLIADGDASDSEPDENVRCL